MFNGWIPCSILLGFHWAVIRTTSTGLVISNECEKSFICFFIDSPNYKISHGSFAFAQDKVRDDRRKVVISNEYEKSMFRLQGEISLFSFAHTDPTTRSLIASSRSLGSDDILFRFEMIEWGITARE
jgi:hypothetical protein